jgi:hypothetical protein
VTTGRMKKLHRTVLFSASGGLFTIAFALLGSGQADAAPAPDFRSGELRPSSAPKKPVPPPKPAPVAPVAKKKAPVSKKVVQTTKPAAKPAPQPKKPAAPDFRSGELRPSTAPKKPAAPAKPTAAKPAEKKTGQPRQDPAPKKPAAVTPTAKKTVERKTAEPQKGTPTGKAKEAAAKDFRSGELRPGATAKKPSPAAVPAAAVKKSVAPDFRPGELRPGSAEKPGPAAKSVSAARKPGPAAKPGVRASGPVEFRSGELRPGSGAKKTTPAPDLAQRVAAEAARRQRDAKTRLRAGEGQAERQAVTEQQFAAAKSQPRPDLAQRVADESARKQRDARTRLRAAEGQAERQALTERQFAERKQQTRDLQATAGSRAAYADSQRGGSPGTSTARAAQDQRVRIAQGQVDYNDALRGQPVGERTAEIVEPVGDDKIRVTNGRTGQSAVHDIPLRSYVHPAQDLQVDVPVTTRLGPLSHNNDLHVGDWQKVPGGQHPGVSVGTTADGSVVAVSDGDLPTDVDRQLRDGRSAETGKSTADGRQVTIYRPQTQYEVNLQDLGRQWSGVAPDGALDIERLGGAVAGSAAIAVDGTIGLHEGNLYGAGKDCVSHGQNCGDFALEAGLALAPLKGTGGLLKGASGVAKGTTAAVEAVGKSTLPRSALPVLRAPLTRALREPTTEAPHAPAVNPGRPTAPPQTSPPRTASPRTASPRTAPPRITPRTPVPPWPSTDPDEPKNPSVPDPQQRETPWQPPRPELPGRPQAPAGPRPLPLPGQRENPKADPEFDDPGRPSTLPDPEGPEAPRAAPTRQRPATPNEPGKPGFRRSSSDNTPDSGQEPAERPDVGEDAAKPAERPAGERRAAVGREPVERQEKQPVAEAGRRNGELVADEMERMVGERATWANFADTGRTFQNWATSSTEGEFPALDPSVKINCWEMVLLAGCRSGALSHEKVHETYQIDDLKQWFRDLPDKLAPQGRQRYLPDDPSGPEPRRGDLIFFNGSDHVAISTGRRTEQGHEVLSFWPPPDTPFTREGDLWSTVDRVKTTTIEQLYDWMRANPGLRTTIDIEFGEGPW